MPFLRFCMNIFFSKLWHVGENNVICIFFANDLLSWTFLTLVEIIYAISDPDMNVDKIVQTWFDGLCKNLHFFLLMSGVLWDYIRKAAWTLKIVCHVWFGIVWTKPLVFTAIQILKENSYGFVSFCKYK